MEVHKYMGGSGYRILDGYPKTIASYLNQPTTPTQVCVCAPDFTDSKLFLFNGDIVYHYTLNGSHPSINFAFKGQFDISVNSAMNPFR